MAGYIEEVRRGEKERGREREVMEVIERWRDDGEREGRK